MKLQKQFNKFRERFNFVFSKYLEEKEKELAKIDPSIIPLFSHLIKIALKGKRLRPFFCYLGYLGFGGEDQEKILRVGISLELLHLFALIHDDIMDKADKRRGVETIHSLFARKTGKEHFGCSVGILAGDLVFTLAEEAFFKVRPYPAARSDLIQNYWQKMIKEVIVGQYLDILTSEKRAKGSPPRCYEVTPRKVEELASIDILARSTKDTLGVARRQATTPPRWRDYWKTMELKTARYSVLRPLQIGAALAGASCEAIEKLTDYALPAGIAFQLRDDILDYQKNKKEASLVSLRGKDYCQKLARELATKAKKGLENVKIGEKELLLELADFMIEREH